jgi:hypothetical protein
MYACMYVGMHVLSWTGLLRNLKKLVLKKKLVFKIERLRCESV